MRSACWSAGAQTVAAAGRGPVSETAAAMVQALALRACVRTKLAAAALHCYHGQCGVEERQLPPCPGNIESLRCEQDVTKRTLHGSGRGQPSAQHGTPPTPPHRWQEGRHKNARAAPGSSAGRRTRTALAQRTAARKRAARSAPGTLRSCLLRGSLAAAGGRCQHNHLCWGAAGVRHAGIGPARGGGGGRTRLPMSVRRTPTAGQGLYITARSSAEHDYTKPRRPPAGRPRVIRAGVRRGSRWAAGAASRLKAELQRSWPRSAAYVCANNANPGRWAFFNSEQRKRDSPQP